MTVARFSGHGLTLALAIGLFFLAGWWVDGWIGSAPLFTILGAMLGAAAGFYHILQHLLFIPRERRAGKDGETDAGDGDGAPTGG